MPRAKNKSSSYQHKLIEINIDPYILNDLPFDTGLGAQVNLANYSEEIYELRQELFAEIKLIIKSNLTKRQAEVIALRLEDKTQIQVAEILGIHQTTVHKLVNGNIDYSNGKKRYGGAIKKIQKICAKSEKIISILDQIKDLKNEEI